MDEQSPPNQSTCFLSEQITVTSRSLSGGKLIFCAVTICSKTIYAILKPDAIYANLSASAF